MPRNMVNHDEIKCRVLKLKTELYDGTHQEQNGDWHEGAHHALNKILDILQEYRY